MAVKLTAQRAMRQKTIRWAQVMAGVGDHPVLDLVAEDDGE